MPARSQAPQSLAAPSLVFPGIIGPGDSIDVCAAISNAELEIIVGHKWVNTVPGPQFQIDQGCTWSFESEFPGVTWDLTVGVLRPHGRQQFDDFSSGGAIETPFPSYGDIAFWSLDNDLLAAKADTLFEVGYIGASGDNTKRIIDAVMKLVVSRLG